MERLFKVINGGGRIHMLRTDGEEPGELVAKMLGKNSSTGVQVEEIKCFNDIPMGYLIEMPFNENERSCAEILSGYKRKENISLYSNKDF